MPLWKYSTRRKRQKIWHWKIGMRKYTNTTLDPAQMEIEREEEEFSHWPPKLPTASASAPWKSRATNSLRTRKCYKYKDLQENATNAKICIVFSKWKKQVQIHPFPIRKLVEHWILTNKSYPDKSTSTKATIHNVLEGQKLKKSRHREIEKRKKGNDCSWVRCLISVQFDSRAAATISWKTKCFRKTFLPEIRYILFFNWVFFGNVPILNL